jgi:hypothetical protein
MTLYDKQANCKLRLSSKKLKSGKVQVQFTVIRESQQEHQGYMLAEPRTALRDVVSKIIDSFDTSSAQIYHAHLFNLGKVPQQNKVIYLNTL